MESLPDDVKTTVCSYLALSDVECLGSVNHGLRPIAQHVPHQEAFRRREAWIATWLGKCPRQIQLLGGYRALLDYPLLEWRDKFLGHTGYIDEIRPEDVSHPVMLGVDSYGRAFATIRTYNPSRPSHIQLETMFQRYSNNLTTWTVGTRTGGFIKSTPHYLSRGVIQHKLLEENMRNLIGRTGGPILLDKVGEPRPVPIYIKLV